MTVRDAGRLAAQIWRRLGSDDVYILASSIAYAAVLSVFPLLIAVIALLSLVVDQTAAQQTVLRALQPYLPEQALALVTETLRGVVRTRETAGVVGAVGLLWGGTAVAGSLREAINRVLGASPRAFWRRKVIDLAMVMLGGLFLSLSLFGSALTASRSARPVARLVERIAGGSGQLVTAVGPVVFSALAFYLAYRFLPNVRLRGRSLLWGTLTGMVLFELLKLAFFWYLRTLSRYPVVYGPLAGLVVFMVWVYLVAVVVLLGAEVMAVLEGRSAHA